MQELFMNMVMATTVGNFITFFLVILIFGVFSIGYESPSEVGVFTSFVGYMMMGAVGLFSFLNGWLFFVGYVVSCVLVAIIQVSVFDIRQMQRIQQSQLGDFRYRWMKFDLYNDNREISKRVKIYRGDLASYIVGYIGCAPFLIVRWVFNEFIKGFSEWVADNIGGMLQRKLERVFNIQEIDDGKATATEVTGKEKQ